MRKCCGGLLDLLAPSQRNGRQPSYEPGGALTVPYETDPNIISGENDKKPAVGHSVASPFGHSQTLFSLKSGQSGPTPKRGVQR